MCIVVAGGLEGVSSSGAVFQPGGGGQGMRESGQDMQDMKDRGLKQIIMAG